MTGERDSNDVVAAAHGPSKARRWYLVVTLLALVLGVAGTVTGWESTEPLYRSTGLVAVRASVPTPRDPAARDVMPMLDEFVRTQAALLRSRRVLTQAMHGPEWERTNSGIDLDGFEDRLKIVRKRENLHIAVRFTDEDPEIAAAGAKAVIRAYMEVAREAGGERGSMLFRYLRDRKAMLSHEHQELDLEVGDTVDPFGGEAGLAMRLEVLHLDLAALERSRRELDRQIRLRRMEGESAALASLSPEEWALRDESMSELVAQRQALEARLEARRKTHGARNPLLVLAKRDLEQVARRVDRLAEMLNEALAGDVGEIHRLIARHSGVLVDIEAVQRALLELGKISSRLRRLLAERERLEASLERVREALEQVEAEQAAGSRILVLSEGEVPVTPHRDRRVPVAAGSGAAGAGLGVCLVLLARFFYRRTRKRLASPVAG